MYNYYLFYKPYNILSQFTNEWSKQGYGSLVTIPKNVYNVGRLDSDSEEPGDSEWTTLEVFLGVSAVAGGKMKAVSPLWLSPNGGATNSSGFSGLPGGYRNFNGSYYYIGSYGN